MNRDDESIYLLDMAACEPRSAVSDAFEQGKWTAVPYSIGQGEGCMLFSGPDTHAPPVRLKLGMSGWHHIFVGTYTRTTADPYCLLLKLSDDPGYTRAVPEVFRPEKDLVSPEMVPGQADLCEAYWKSADLTGREIVFHRPAAGEMAETVANIAYIRLLPASEEEQAWIQRNRTRTDTRRLLANYDSGQHHMWGYGTDREMVDEFQALAHSDFKMILWGCAGSTATFYPSKVGSEVTWSFGLPGATRRRLASLDRSHRHGFDALRSAVRCAHEVRIEIYPQVRMIGEQLPPHHLGYVGPGAFQTEHPEYRCLTREGYRTRHLSQAFPQVRAQYVALFREWVEEYDGDGVCIVFCRSWPYVLYEEPVVRSFREQYGLDMKMLDRFDERVLAHRASFLTQLLRETRAMLDEVGARRGKRLGTCYVVPADAYTAEGCPDLGPFTPTRSQGMDVVTWVKEGLVDHLVVHIEGVGSPDASDRPPVIRPYVDLAQGTDTQVYADLYPRRQSGDSMRARAIVCYEAGVDGLCFWDSHGRSSRLSGWAMHRLLGHKEELAEMKLFSEGLFRLVPLISIDGYRADHPECRPTDG